MKKQEMLTLIRALEMRIVELENRPNVEKHTHHHVHNYPRPSYPYQSPGWYSSMPGLMTYNNVSSGVLASNGDSSMGDSDEQQPS